MMPVKTCRMNSASAALPKTYHQLADLRGARSVLVVHAAVTRAHKQTGLREPTDRASKVSTVNSEDLKLIALHATNPARNVVGFSVGNTGDGILKLCQASLPFGKLVEFTESDPA